MEDGETIEAIFIRETERAVCLRETEGSEDVWLPKSQCRFAPRVDTLDRGDVVSVTGPEWLLTERGLL